MIGREVWACLLLCAAVRAQDGPALYQKHCASCHDAGAALRAPARAALRKLSPEEVLDTLEAGSMFFVALNRTAAERRAIAMFVTGSPFGQRRPPLLPQRAMCPADPKDWTGGMQAPHWNGWGACIVNSRLQPPGMA